MRASLVVVPLGLLAAIQLVPLQRTNPPAEAALAAPPAVQALLERACYDCHSHETRWGPQAYVAPASWLVVHDVNEGREEMNFSLWGRYDEKRRKHLAGEMDEVMEEAEMPPALYLLSHPSARLPDAERALLRDWARTLQRGEAHTGR